MLTASPAEQPCARGNKGNRKPVPERGAERLLPSKCVRVAPLLGILAVGKARGFFYTTKRLPMPPGFGERGRRLAFACVFILAIQAGNRCAHAKTLRT